MDESRIDTTLPQTRDRVESLKGDASLHSDDRPWNGNTLGKWKSLRESSTQHETTERIMGVLKERSQTESLGGE